MAEIIDIDLTSNQNANPHLIPLSEYIKCALLADAHAYRSHRLIDSYLSKQRVFPIIREMIESLADLPDYPYDHMVQRLDNIAATQGDTQTALGSDIRETLLKDCFFAHLDEHIREQVEKNVQSKHFSKGEVLCQKGQPATTVFILLKGSLLYNGVSIPQGHVLCLNAVLQGNTAYSCEVKAENNAEVALLTKEQCVRIIYENQLSEISGNNEKFFKYMKSSFPRLADEEIDLIGQISNFVCFDKGDYIAKKEQVLTSFYVVLSVFDRRCVDLECIKANSNRIAQMEVEKAEIRHDYIAEGQVIGASGVVLGRDEKRDWYCYGVVECLRVDYDELKKRSELFGKMVRMLNE